MIKLEVHRKHFHYILNYSDCLEKKHVCTWAVGWTSPFFGIPFYVKKEWHDSLWLSRLGRHFLENNMNISLQRKQQLVLVANGKIGTYKQIRILKKCVLAPWVWCLPNNWRLCDEIDKAITKCGIFWIVYGDQCKYVNIWKIFITLNSANQYFSSDQSMKLQN